MDEATRKLLDVFFCYNQERLGRVRREGRQLAHYTTADTAMKIMRGRSLWLRNAAVMNDYAEVHYGWQVMDRVLAEQGGDQFREALEAICGGLADDVMRRHEESSSQVRECIFTASLSEHDRSDVYGRLSMWRAYGGPVAGVALLFKGDVAEIEVEPSLGVTVSPVLYGGLVEFAHQLEKVTQSLKSEIEFLKSVDRQVLSNVATLLLQFAMISIKHPGFREEEEWRVIHKPYEYSSAAMMAKPFTIGGIPQTIYELPFHNPERGELFDIPQLDLNAILEGIIIGPCAYPETVVRAFIDAMSEAGIHDAKNRIQVSHIPLRQRW